MPKSNNWWRGGETGIEWVEEYQVDWRPQANFETRSGTLLDFISQEKWDYIKNRTDVVIIFNAIIPYSKDAVSLIGTLQYQKQTNRDFYWVYCGSTKYFSNTVALTNVVWDFNYRIKNNGDILYLLKLNDAVSTSDHPINNIKIIKYKTNI